MQSQACLCSSLRKPGKCWLARYSPPKCLPFFLLHCSSSAPSAGPQRSLSNVSLGGGGRTHTFGGEQIVRVLIGNSPLPGATLKSANHVRVIMEIVGQSFGLPIKVPPTPLCSLNCPGVAHAVCPHCVMCEYRSRQSTSLRAPRSSTGGGCWVTTSASSLRPSRTTSKSTSTSSR